jgi:HSP20 family protein
MKNALESIKQGIGEVVAETRRRLRRGREGDGDGSRELTLVEPRVDIFETPERVTILLDVPGVKQDGLRIETVRDRLEVHALRADREAARALSGVVPDGYRVSWRLDPTLAPEGIEAELRDGVLRLRIPRSEAAKPRRIEVK